MKLTRFLILSLGLTLGLTMAKGASNSGIYWADGVSETGGWYDANKVDNNDGDADDNMCYAASASNLIAWWQNGEAGSALTTSAPTELNNIWQSFIGANQHWDEGGEALSSINWWISGIYCPESREDAEAWERFYVKSEDYMSELTSVTLAPFEGYYYDQYALSQKHLADFMVDFSMISQAITEVDFADLLQTGCGVTLAVATIGENGESENGHAITLWGVEYDEDGKLKTIWITDSDDGNHELVKVSVTVDEENDKIWLSDEFYGGKYFIDEAYAIDVQESLKWPLYQKQHYVNTQVNPTTQNGRAGAALLPEVLLSEAPEEGGAMDSVLAAVAAGAMGDKEAAAVAGASTAVMGQALSDDMERQLRAMRNRAAMGSSSKDAVVLHNGKYADMEWRDTFFVWANAEVNHAEQEPDSTFAGYTLSNWGGTLGAAMLVDDRLSLGMAVTAMFGDLQSDGPDRLDGDMDTTYLSAFARYNHGKWSHSVVGSMGAMDADYSRYAMNNTTKGETEGSTFGFMYELSRGFALNAKSSISPVFNVAYRHTTVDGYNEHGADTALCVGEQNLDTVTVALGARYAAEVGLQTMNRNCAFEARALVKYDFGDTQTGTSVGFVDYENRAGIESSERGAVGLELGTGIAVPVGSGCIFADGAVELRSDYTNFNATFGYKIAF